MSKKQSGLAWRFFCEQKKEEISSAVRKLLKGLFYLGLFVGVAIIVFWINWVLFTSIVPLDCNYWDYSDEIYNCGFGHSFASVLFGFIEVFIIVLLASWIWSNWDDAKRRAGRQLSKKRNRGN